MVRSDDDGDNDNNDALQDGICGVDQDEVSCGIAAIDEVAV